MDRLRSRLSTLGRSLRARGRILVQQPGMEILGANDFSGVANWRVEFKPWERGIFYMRYSLQIVEIVALLVGVFAEVIYTLGIGLNVGHLSFFVVFVVLTLVGWIMHLFFHNDDYVRIRQWAFTIVRLFVATSFVIWDVRYTASPFYVESYSLLVAACVALWITASGSYVRYRRDKRRLTAKVEHPWNSTYNLHLGTQYRIKQLSDVERVRRQERAIQYMTDKTKQSIKERTAFWYQQKPLLATIPEKYTPVSLKDSYSSESLFSRCYCCLDSDLFAETSTRLKQKWKFIRPSWRSKRSAFLKQPTISDFDGVLSLSTVKSNETGVHNLCEKCEFMCSESNLVNLYKLHHDWGSGPPPEMFEHHSSPRDLQQSATNETPCHLCALIWAVMSAEQQIELLKIDELITHEMQLALDACANTWEKEGVRGEYHQKRCVTVRVETLTVNSQYTQTASETYALNVLFLGFGPRFIPHFGGTRVPRHWENKRLIKEAMAVGLDPALVSKHLEQAPGILVRGGYHKLGRNEDLMSLYLNQVPPVPIRGEYRKLNKTMINGSWWARAKLNNKGPILQPISSSTGSDETIDIVSSWLKNHEECMHGQVEPPAKSSQTHEGIPLVDMTPGLATSQTYTLPTRLIDVRADKFRLRLSSEILAASYEDKKLVDTRYIALSHCWAGEPFLTLTEASYQRFVDGEEVPALCQTFQDAIRVTRQLGYSYMWVDSLCIIQNTDDCLTELPKMGDVYANADCVIAAAAAWDNSETIFSPQNPLEMSPCLVAVAGKMQGVVKRFEGIYAFPTSRFTYDADREISFARLNSRAWCLQELKLAKRVLWFGQTQVQFICKGHEKIYSQASMFLEYAQHRYGRFGNRLDLIARRLQDTDGLLTSQWWHLVEEYTSRWLTRNTDKLNALGGMAQHFQRERPNADYLAGLWSGPYFVTGLLWYVTDRQKAINQRKLSMHFPMSEMEEVEAVKSKSVFRAPSWSWASVDGIISNNSFHGSGAPSTCLLTVTDISQVFNSAALETDTNEAVAAPHIRVTVRGIVQRATWTALPPSEPMHYIGYRPTRNVELHKDLEALIPVTFDPSQGPTAFALMRSTFDGNGDDQAGDELQEQSGWFLPDTEDDMPKEFYCLRVCVEPESEEGKRDFALPFVMRGVALVPVTQSETLVNEGSSSVEMFRRVGYFELRRTEGGLRYPDVAFSGPVSLTDSTLPARWPYPVVDPDGFFGGCAERLLCIE